MTGLAYYRIKKDISRQEFAERVGVCTTATVYTYENLAYQGRGCCDTWLAFSDALEVPVSELMRTDLPELVDRKSGWIARLSRTANPNNPIAVYRDTHRLTFMEIAEIIGCSTRESGRLACAAQKPLKKHIAALARYENISPEAFIKKYRVKSERKN